MGKALAAWMMVATALAAPAVGPREAVESTIDRVLGIIQNGTVEAERRAEILRVASKLFDFQEMSRRTLSRHWAARTPAERDEFVALFTDLLQRTYLNRIEAYAGEEISYLGEAVDGGYALVKSRVVTARRTEIALDYRLHLRDTRWKVYDVLIDGVSFISTFRSQFDRVIKAESFTALMEKLRRKRLEATVVDRGRDRL